MMTSDSKSTGHFFTRLQPILFFIAILPLAAHAIAGAYTPLIADDFCSAGIVRQSGIFFYEHTEYFGWSGRYSAHILDGIVGLIGPIANEFFPALAIILWLISLILILKKYNLRLIIAPIILTATLATIPNVSQSLYWGQGMRSVIPPLILATFSLVVNLPLTALLLTFVIGGFSETFAAIQVILFLLLFIVAKNRRSLYLYSLIGAILAIVVVIVAPGNAGRSSFYPPHPNIVNLVKGTIYYALLYIWQNITKNYPILMSVFSLSLLFKRINYKVPFWIIPITTILLIVISFAPAYWGMNASMPDRTMVIPQYLFITGIFVWGYTLNVNLPSKINYVIIIMASIVAINNAVNISNTIPIYQKYYFTHAEPNPYGLSGPAVDWVKKCILQYNSTFKISEN